MKKAKVRQKKTNKGKSYEPSVSLYPLTVEKALKAFMKVKPKSEKNIKNG